MQAVRLRFFVDELRKDPTFANVVRSWTVYARIKGVWTTEDSQPLQDSALSERLEQISVSLRFWRPPHSCRAYFPIQQLSLVLGADFESPPRSIKLSKTASALKRALKHSLDAFNADHDPLTGAPNRVAFDKKLAEAIDKSLVKIEGSSDALTAAEVAAPSTLALVALDIDHFKQLNDTYGHLYGDVVLQIFTRRLERCLADLERKFGERLQASVARLGGEEFGVLVQGVLTLNDLNQVAEDIRCAIADNPLPTDEEWAAVGQSTTISSLSSSYH
jgi:diguanylate cyclase (GGDEF)-like protein